MSMDDPKDPSPETDVTDVGGPAGEPAPAPDRELSDEVIWSRLESLIFSSAEPLTPATARRILAVDGKRLKKALEDLVLHYSGRGIRLVEVAGGWQFRSNPENAPLVRRLLAQRPVRLSRPSMETLAIAAYRQPITRPEIEEIRGVDSGGIIKLLLERDLLKILGKKEEPGRPIIYGTTQAFLALFGLKSLSDLPPLREFVELTQEHQDMVDEVAPAPEPSVEPASEPADPIEPRPSPAPEQALEDSEDDSDEDFDDDEEG